MCAVLLVEDEALVAEVMQEQLADEGYRVVWAPDAFGALAVLERRAAGVDALVTDVDLGAGPNGFEVARRAREIDPALPVLYVTGQAEGLFANHGVSGAGLLPKPFQPAELSRAVGRLAAGRARGRPALQGCSDSNSLTTCQ